MRLFCFLLFFNSFLREMIILRYAFSLKNTIITAIITTEYKIIKLFM